MALIDFTLSNARRFYSSMGNPSGLKGLTVCITKLLQREKNIIRQRSRWRCHPCPCVHFKGGGVGAVVRSLPSNPKVPGSIPGSAESGIFGDLLSR